MSFATGLFSFMGGMSQQYREEVDAKRALNGKQNKTLKKKNLKQEKNNFKQHSLF